MKKIILGIMFCIIFTIPPWILGGIFPVIGAPIFAIILGILLSFIVKSEKLMPGIKFTSKKILQYSIVLLGFNMNFIAVMQVGKNSLALILGTIFIALIVGFIASKAMRLPSNTAILITVGSSICGGSAIAATAPVLQAKDDEIASSISTIFLFNVIAALVFPTIGVAIGLSDTGFGLWAGTAVNDTSSVVAAATTWSEITGSNTALELATIVKLTRTLAIIPITFFLAVYISRKKYNELAESDEVKDKNNMNNFKLRKIFPWFIVFFLLSSLLNTIFSFPTEISEGLVTLGKFMITMAMFSIGVNTDVKKMFSNGIKPIVLGLICWVSIAVSSIIIQIFTNMY